MSGSDGRGFRVGARAGIVAIGLLSVLNATAHAKGREAQHGTQNDQGYTAENPLFIEARPSPKTAKEAAADEQERAEKRANDANMVRLTFALSVIGVLQLVVFSYQSYVLRRTLSESRTTIAASQRSAAAAEAAVAKSDEMLSHARDAAIEDRASNKRIERAYIFMSLGPREVSDDQNITSFDVTLTNCGKTPGVVKSLGTHIFYEPLPDFPPDLDSKNFIVNTVYGANVSITPFRTHFNSAGNPFVFYGHITYVDIFGESHHSRFCCHINPKGATVTTQGPAQWNIWD